MSFYHKQHRCKIDLQIQTMESKSINTQQSKDSNSQSDKPQQSMLNLTTNSNPVNQDEKKSTIQSSAFPSSKLIAEQSISHKILAHSYAITNNFTMRTGIKQSDIIEIRHLQLQWFPLQYGDYFYEKLLAGKYKCLITQTDVVIEWAYLKQILSEKYEIQQNFWRMNKEKNGRNQLFLAPSTYFQNQGIRYEHLYKQNEQDMDKAFAHLKTVPPKNIQESNSKPFSNLLKIKLIISVMVFDITISNGYLGGAWWTETLFNASNSIYINTIGVSHEFRKTGMAKKMLEWLIQKMKKQGNLRLLYLHVIEYNQAAIRLYKGFGFKELNVLEDYYHIDGKGYKGIMLGLYLNGGSKRVGWKQWIGKIWS